MERTYDEERHKRNNHVLRERTCVQICSVNNWLLHKQLENQNTIWAEIITEMRGADFIFE